MADIRLERLGRLLVEYSTAVQAGEKVVITSTTPAGMPLVREIYREVIRAGGLPLVWLDSEELTELLLLEGNDAQVEYVHSPIQALMEEYDVRIGLRALVNTRYLSSVDPARQALHSKGKEPLLATMFRRTAARELRWCATLFPTAASAQDADMSLREYEDFMFRACHVDQEDPVALWTRRSQQQQRLVEWLAGKDRVSIKGANIDMRLSIAGRTFNNDDGHFNMPGGEIFTAPVEESVEGWIRFSYPASHGGREVDGVELYFEEGRVVRATASKNEAFLHSVLDTDAGARYMGEWAIGTNYGIDRFTRNTLFDEKIGGTLHIALGAGYPETGSRNQSAVHWDMICDLRDGAEIYVDGERFYAGGQFVVE